MNEVTLPADLQRFAEDAVASGHYRDLSELVAASLALLRRAEADRADFIGSLEAAQAEAVRDGWHELDDVLAEVDAIIDEEVRARV